MKLYNASGSCSSASHIALIEAGLEFEVVELDLRTDRKLPDGRHLDDVNPKGYVPALELDDGSVLTENIAILQYIADLNPDARLAPPSGTRARTRLQEWLGYINSEVHKTFSPFFALELPPEVRDYFSQRLDTRLGYIDAQLEGRDYLMGDTFSVADAYLFVVVGWGPMVGYSISGHPTMAAWHARIGERDSVKTALKQSPFH